MEPERKAMRACAIVVLGAVVLRLLGGSFWESTVEALGTPEAASVILFLETGRYVRPDMPYTQNKPVAVPIPQKKEESPALPVFSESDAGLVEIRNTSGYDVEASGLLEMGLRWNLCQGRPTVLILHTHATESYTNTENYQETTKYRTQDTAYNVVSIGDRVAQLLEEAGIQVIHDRTLHDVPSYNYSYTAARAAAAQALGNNDGLLMVLDIHRDSVENSSGKQVATTVTTEKGEAAQVMLVVGSDAGGQEHPNWEVNLSLAVKLQAQLEKNCPGICRPIQLRSQRYNQDLSAGALLVEVGAAGNTRQQALLAAEQLACAIIALAGGCEYA